MAVPYIEHLLNQFLNDLGSEQSKWVLDHFHGQKSIDDMFTFLWDFEESHRLLTPTLVPSGKSESEANKLRSEGDNYFTQGNLDKALELYNLSIMAAPHPPLLGNAEDKINNNEACVTRNYKDLATAYACRSAVLFELEQYEKCKFDINLALTHGCPESFHKKLEERMLKCNDMLTNTDGISDGCQLGSEVNFDDLYAMIEKCSEVANEKVTSKDVLKISQQKRKLPKVSQPHENIPALSSSLKMAYTPSKGRHLIAANDIYPGDVVGMEKSFCNAIYLENLHNHCSTCLMECFTPLPCPDCTMVIFCSEDCRSEGLSGSHWQECNLLPTLATLEIKENVVTYMAFRLISKIPFGELKEKLPVLRRETAETDPIRRGFNSEGLYSSTDYRPVYHLVSNTEQRPSKELFETCVTAFVLTQLLVKGQRFFLDSSGQPVNPTRDDLLMIGQLFFHHILNIFCNAFQLSDMKVTAAPVKTVLNVFGEGVFPGLSLINHSCNPTVRHYNYGNHMVLRAVTYIPAGKEVTTTYCGSFYKEDAEIRREHLTNSYINCTCEACTGNWPITGSLPMKLSIKCMACSVPIRNIEQFPRCPACRLDYGESHHDENTGQLVEKWWSVVQKLHEIQSESQLILLRKKSGQPPMIEDFSVLSEFVKLLHDHVQLPCQSWCYAMDTLFFIFCLEFCSPDISLTPP